jgi:hypothetical protein
MTKSECRKKTEVCIAMLADEFNVTRTQKLAKNEKVTSREREVASRSFQTNPVGIARI